MNKILNLFLLILIISSHATFSFASNHYPITLESKLNNERGKLLYTQYCASCHQVNLSGAEDWKGYDADGHRKAPPLNGTGHTWHHSDETLHQIIKYGFAKLIKNYEGKMIGFEEDLSDKEIDYILGFIKSHWNDEYYDHQISISIK